MPTPKCPPKPKKKPTEKLLNWDAHYVGISALRERQRNSITLEEVVDEAMRLLSPSAPIITEDQIPQFTAWGVEDLKQNMMLLKNHYSLRHLNY
jgi:valyl-tRNA synthetase